MAITSSKINIFIVLMFLLAIEQIAAQQVQTIEKNNEIQDDRTFLINMIKNLILAGQKQPPRTILYGPYYAKQNWITYPVLGQMLSNPLSANITIEKKSIVTFTLNGHINTGLWMIQVLFLIDGSPFVKKLDAYYYADSYFQASEGYQPLNLVQETVIKPGTYLFEVGQQCSGYTSQFASYVTMNAVGYTIKVQELE